MRSASTSLCGFLRDRLNLKKDYLERAPRDWKGGEGVEGYMHYPSSTAILMPQKNIVKWVTCRETLVQEHLLPVQHHRDILMSINEQARKVVVMKRYAEDSFRSQLNRVDSCHYLSRSTNKERCREEFKRFRENIEIMFPEKDGFLHVEFSNLVNNQDKEIKRVLDYWEFSYSSDDIFRLPHLRKGGG